MDRRAGDELGGLAERRFCRVHLVDDCSGPTGHAAFEAGIEELKRDAQGMPPIRGISRSSGKAYTVLYKKGALVLYRLEQEMGREAFQQYLAKLAGTRSRSVDGALALLEQCGSSSARASLEKMLLE